ncbi:hypothetical protein TCAL_03200 [Tigriopus californicus]|uniref:ZAD domain-containing protein n=1 Tax=Tigriopus californicus TaxID=6832 RepID=A0A553N651_TIGCA|nr:uncharacterized protein LOC131885340 [Tigriopus californicus]TRY60921.1 hypothetical protein TCAL_03200 [Tigriopus californicus]|eukprot:TCALIF_03200-PA protein Name:"Protein of unknown function" AED:0.00 eAED:0.00 QI:282/1/1/1/0.66/0.71/7/228/740
MSLLRSDNPMSSTSSVASCSSSINEPLPPNKYLMKTLCFSKKSMSMPSKEEYSRLLSCGLGARKWQVNLDLDSKIFQLTLLNIYPRLSTVSNYSLWTINKNKTFEKLPQKVDTPSRIRAYLGSQFSGCLVIMPSEEISLGPSPTVNGVETDVGVRNAYKSSLSRDKSRITNTCERNGLSYPNNSSQYSQATNTLNSLHSRSICLLCGRMAKQLGSSAFYNIDTHMLNSESGGETIAARLKEIIRVTLPRKKLIPSEEICKKCFRQLNEIDYLENQLKSAKDEVVNNFFHTVSKISRMDPHVLHQNGIAARHHSPVHLASSSATSSTSSGYMEGDLSSLNGSGTNSHADFPLPQRVYIQAGQPGPFHGSILSQRSHGSDSKPGSGESYRHSGLNLVPVNLNYQSSASAVAAVMAAAAAVKEQRHAESDDEEATKREPLSYKMYVANERHSSSRNLGGGEDLSAHALVTHAAGRLAAHEEQNEADLLRKAEDDDQSQIEEAEKHQKREDLTKEAQNLSQTQTEAQDGDGDDEEDTHRKRYYGSLWQRHLKQKAQESYRRQLQEAETPDTTYLSYNRVLHHYRRQMAQSREASVEVNGSDRSTSDSPEGSSPSPVSPSQSIEPESKNNSNRWTTASSSSMHVGDHNRPWKKRYREKTHDASIDLNTEPKVKSYRSSSSPESAKSSSNEPESKDGQSMSNSNTDSGLGGSDEDSGESNSNEQMSLTEVKETGSDLTDLPIRMKS